MYLFTHLFVYLFTYLFISRVSGQNGVSLLSVMIEIHHSGREPSIYFIYVFVNFSLISVLIWGGGRGGGEGGGC